MANILYIPFSNPAMFHEMSPAESESYLSKSFEDYKYFDTIYPWQEKRAYQQKWQRSDPMRIQVQSNFEPLQIDIINHYGNVVNSVSAALIMPNKYIQGMSVYEFTISFTGLADGCYFLRLTTGNLSELNMPSEPILLKEKHEGTLFLEYRNNRFHDDVIYETGITFGFRVEGAFDFLQPGAHITAYEDQRANPYILSGRPFRVWPLVIGGSYGIPDWVVDKFNRIWTCNDVRVDSKSYARNGEAQITSEDIDDYPMRGITLEVREGINRGSKIVSPNVDPNKKLVVVYEIDASAFGGIGNSPGFNNIQIIDTE